jgi:hypothetical protein
MKKYVLCIPKGGLNDMFSIIYECLLYSRKFNRILVIDTRNSTHFKDSIHKYIEINDPNIYTDTIESWYSTIDSKTIYPEYVKDIIHTINPEWVKPQTFYHNNIGPLHFDLNKNYSQDILVYVRCGGGRVLHKLLSQHKLKDIVKNVFIKRRALLPVSYVGVHIRHSDISSDIPTFMKKNADIFLNNPIFIASDNLDVIKLFRETYREVYAFSEIGDFKALGVASIQKINRSDIDHENYNIDTLVDLLLLGSSDIYLYSIGSGYSMAAKALFDNKAIINNLISI